MIFFDNAAGSFPKPPGIKRAVIEAFDKYGANPGRGAYKLSLNTSRMVFDTRQKMAALFNCPEPQRFVFTAGATESANIALKGWLKSGDHVIYSGLEHNALWRPLMQMEEEGWITTTRVKTDEYAYVNADDFKKAIRPETRLIVCIHAGNVSGSVQPIADIGRIAKEHNIPLLVDAAQSAGFLPIDVLKQNISFLVVAGHKALYGPPGTGGLYVAEGLDLFPLICGGTGSNSSEHSQPPMYPDRLESGTPNVWGIAGLNAAVSFIERKGIEDIYQKVSDICNHFIEDVRNINGITVYVPDKNRLRVPVVSINLEMDSGDVAYILDSKYDIAVRSGIHCAPLAHIGLGTAKTGTVRFSFGYYNTKTEVDLAVKVLSDIAKNKI